MLLTWFNDAVLNPHERDFNRQRPVNAENGAVIFIDHQPQMFFGLPGMDRQDLLNNVTESNKTHLCQFKPAQSRTQPLPSNCLTPLTSSSGCTPAFGPPTPKG